MSLKERKSLHPKRYNQVYKKINYFNCDDRFKGIINYLGNGTPNEIFEKGIISVSSSQVHNIQNYNIINLVMLLILKMKIVVFVQQIILIHLYYLILLIKK